MLAELDNYDWESAFGENSATQCEPPTPTAVIGDPASTGTFCREDVARIIGLWDNEEREQELLGVFQLKDGRFASLEAGCDYTGWD